MDASGKKKAPAKKNAYGSKSTLKEALPAAGVQSEKTLTDQSHLPGGIPREALWSNRKDNSSSVSSVSQTLKKAKSVNIKKLIEADIGNLKKQLQHYTDVCEKIEDNILDPKDIIDSIHIMVKSLLYDTVSIQLVDFEKEGELMPLISRGYKKPPSQEITENWKQSVSPGGSIDWASLMTFVEGGSTEIADFFETEALSRFGFVPIHDGKKIFGFFIVASYEEKEPSTLASTLLELCGGRYGLAIANSRKRESSAAAVLPEKTIESVKLLHKKFSLLSKYIDLLKDAENLTVDEIKNLAENCNKALDESIAALEKINPGVLKEK
jgi:hypothetical protein